MTDETEDKDKKVTLIDLLKDDPSLLWVTENLWLWNPKKEKQTS